MPQPNVLPSRPASERRPLPFLGTAFFFDLNFLSVILESKHDKMAQLDAFHREIRWLSGFRQHSDIHSFHEHRYSSDFEARFCLHIDWMLASAETHPDVDYSETFDLYLAQIARIAPFVFSGKSATEKFRKRLHTFLLDRLSFSLCNALEQSITKHFPHAMESLFV